MISEKLIEKPWMFSRLWRAFVANNFTLGGGGNVALVEEILYDDLVDKIDDEELEAGKHYIITDFKTTFNLNISDTLYDEATVEPIVVTAMSNNKLEPIAYSLSHPLDVLYYDVDGTTYMPGSTKGCIYRRIDTEKNISVPFDFRQFKVEYSQLNDPPVYNSEAEYARGKIVLYSDVYHVSKKNANTGNIGDPNWWINTGLGVPDFRVINSWYTNFLETTIEVYIAGAVVVSPFTVSNSINFNIKHQPTTISESIFVINGYVQNCDFDRLSSVYIGSNVIDC